MKRATGNNFFHLSPEKASFYSQPLAPWCLFLLLALFAPLLPAAPVDELGPS